MSDPIWIDTATLAKIAAPFVTQERLLRLGRQEAMQCAITDAVDLLNACQKYLDWARLDLRQKHALRVNMQEAVK